MLSKKVSAQILKIVILTALFCGAVYFENAQQQRLFILLGVFAAYIVVGLFRVMLKGNESLYSYSFLLDTALVYAMEHQSRLLINYFLHSFYIIILLEVSLTLKRNRGLVIGTAAVLVSLIKYVLLIHYKFNLSNVSQMAFFLLANVLILVIVNFAQYNREEREKKDILYKELLDTHKQLRQYTEEVNRLAIVEERNRIARDIHDTLGHNMTALIMQIEMADHMMDENISEAKEILEKAKKTARGSLSGIREVVETLRGKDEQSKAAESIKELVSAFSGKTGVEVTLNIDGEAVKQEPAVHAALYRIIQEALTNSVRHGKATNVMVDISYSDEEIGFKIKDNGIGADSFKEGYGIKGIRERVEALAGKVEFETQAGFCIKGYLRSEGLK